jgi:putative ABC transport system substrate-binding protein
MKRRAFIAGLGCAAVWPIVARAQQPEAVKRIAILMGIAENDSEGQARVAAFRQGLQELNWVDGRNARIDIRWGAGDALRTSIYAKELVDVAPDVILATNTPTARALKQSTEAIPIVFAGLSDPIADGIVTSLSKPEGNITGFTSFNGAIAGKWLQLLKEVSPGIERVVVIYNPDTAPYAIFLPVMDSVAPQVAVTLTHAPVRDKAAIENTISKIGNAPGGGLVILPDVFMALNRHMIFDLAARAHLPTTCPVRQFATAGGLLSYGSNFSSLFRQSASYIDRILRGEKPRELPVQDPVSYELIVNLKTAKTLGLTIPPSLLARADEVIE